jgi:hypothetical protein
VLLLVVTNDYRLEQARLWRLKAEELRTVADQMKNPMAQDSFLRMAEFYDRLARQWEERAAGAVEKKPEAS